MALTADETARLFFERKSLDQQLALIWQRLETGIGINASDVEIGAVELKDGTTDTRAKIADASTIVMGDNAVAVRDAASGSELALVKGFVDAIATAAGIPSDAAVITNANGTIQQYLRGLVTLQSTLATSSAFSQANTAALVSNRHVQVPAKLRTIVVSNSAIGIRYLQFFDLATVPADGAVPIRSVPLSAGGYFESEMQRNYAAGIYVCNSTTQFTKTLGGAEFLIDLGYN